MRFSCHSILLAGLLAGVMPMLYADPLTRSNPLTDCLNGQIVPQMGSNEAPEAIVNQAFLLCRPFINDWLTTYPVGRRAPLERALRQFYLDRLNAALNRSFSQP